MPSPAEKEPWPERKNLVNDNKLSTGRASYPQFQRRAATDRKNATAPRAQCGKPSPHMMASPRRGALRRAVVFGSRRYTSVDRRAPKLGSDDREVHLAENVSVQLELDLVVASLLDEALRKHNNALIQLGATGGFDRGNDVLCGHGTEELALLRGLHRHLDVGELLELGANLACVVQVANCASFLGALDALDLLLSTTGGNDGQTARKQVVTSVAVLNLNNIACGAEVLNGSGDGTFNPNGQLTRGAAMIMIYNYLSR